MQLFNKRPCKTDVLLKERQEAMNAQKQKIENLKKACSEIFATPNGKYLLQFLLEFCGWNDQDMNINGEILAYKKGKRDVWVLLRNLLPRDVLAQVEIYGQKDLSK